MLRMATNSGHQTTSVIKKQLQFSPERFGFVQVVRLLSRFTQELELPTQFKINPNQCFPVSDIESLHIIKAETPHQRYVVTVNFLGLIGQDGILPAYVNEYIITRLQQKDDSLLEFLQIFQHHLLQLFSDLVQRRHFFINLELQKPDVLLKIVDCISGQTRQTEDIKRRYASFYGHQVRSATSLCQLLQNHFELPVEVTQYTPTWITLDEHDITILGGAKQQQIQLGQNTLLGSRIWHVQNHFTLWVGPLNFEQFMQFLPRGHYYKTLNAIVSDYIGLEYDFTIKLLLRRDAIPGCELRYQKVEQLGWTTWLSGKKIKNDYVIVTLNQNR